MLQSILRAAQAGQSATNPVQILEAEVVSAPPNLQIRLKQDAKMIIPKELLVIAEHLTRHQRVITITHQENVVRHLGDGNASDMVSGDGLIFTVNDDGSSPLSGFAYSNVLMQYEDVLKVGDSVVIASFQGGQKFLILDRLVTY
ncbi:DUF2577 domain-containing protein [Desulforamulus aquiferis]|uniref:DUF2577 domain-containing protein n=1 Tax=Desulforamulus aquiferis TaxID=1397668 RepID=A0AAW7ZCZ4_9FIRM|nr:DUF2577 domain-containing protein [Desulforamulus aquiferis]MDO7787119.1 DUF2577 domain-containing protein [Desulforamulus aquiferis]